MANLSRLPSNPMQTGRAPRAVTASSSLGTIRARIAELRRIVTEPERYMPGLDEQTRVKQVLVYQHVILRLEDMEHAKTSTRRLSDTQPMPNNTIRRAVKAPLTTLNELRLHVLTALDGLRISHRIDATKGVLLESSEALDRACAIMRERIDQAQAEIHAQIARNLLMLYGDSTDGEETNERDSAISTESETPAEQDTPEETHADVGGSGDGSTVGA